MTLQTGTVYSSNSDDDDEVILLRSALRIPFSGYRLTSDGSFNGQGLNGYYCSSSSSGLNSAYNMYFIPGGGIIANGWGRGNGFPARCLRN